MRAEFCHSRSRIATICRPVQPFIWKRLESTHWCFNPKLCPFCRVKSRAFRHFKLSVVARLRKKSQDAPHRKFRTKLTSCKRAAPNRARKTLGHLHDRGLVKTWPNPLGWVQSQSRWQLSPQLQCSHPHDSQVQFSQVPSAQPQSSHWQLSPQQQLFAAESAAKPLKPRTDAPATTAVAKSFDVRDMIKNLLRASLARVMIELE
jgi:hypothetical protein